MTDSRKAAVNRVHGTKDPILTVDSTHATTRSKALSIDELIDSFETQKSYKTEIMNPNSVLNTSQKYAKVSQQPIQESDENGSNNCILPIGNGYSISSEKSNENISNYSRLQIPNSAALRMRLDLIEDAIRNWDLMILSKLFDNLKFNQCLAMLMTDDDVTHRFENNLKRSLIKKMILEQIVGLTYPFRFEFGVKERELSLITVLSEME